MKTTANLLDEAIKLGFDKEEALKSIDAALDEVLGFENRKDLDKEELSEELYETILFSFQCEAECFQCEAE